MAARTSAVICIMPANTTILSSVRLNGETAYTIYRGRTTREKFLDYLR